MTAAAQAERPMSIAEQATLVHGFSMADVDRASEIVVRKHLYSTFQIPDFDERLGLAWTGIVEELYGCGCGQGSCSRTTDLTFFDLLIAGRAALDKEVSDRLRHRGRKNDTGETGANFNKYWLPVMRQKHLTDDGFSNRLCEALSLRSALSVLTPRQYEVVSTFAAFNNSGIDAAAALGMRPKTFYSTLSDARRRIGEVWFEHETAPVKRKSEDACTSGHPRSEYGRKRADGNWRCHKCQLEQARRSRQNDLEARRAYDRRWKKHKRGNHTECLPEKCEHAAAASTASAEACA